MRKHSARDLNKLKRNYCDTCSEDFYNGHNSLGVKQCWHLAGAKVKWREIYLSLHSRKPTKIRTLDCFNPRR